MSSNPEDFLGDRRRALEESFFHKRDQELLERFRQQRLNQERKQALAAVSGIRDETVLEHLLQANVSDETISALAIVPLVVVAWADGELDDRERQAILKASEAEGIASGSVSYDLLQGWLASPPQPNLLTAWKDFVKAANKQLSKEAASALREDILGRARKVAHASGGLLGLGSISSAEQRVLQDLESAFN